jgi:hypothetical protein
VRNGKDGRRLLFRCLRIGCEFSSTRGEVRDHRAEHLIDKHAVAIESVLAGVSGMSAALRVHHRTRKLRKFQLHVGRFMGGFRRWASSYPL